MTDREELACLICNALYRDDNCENKDRDGCAKEMYAEAADRIIAAGWKSKEEWEQSIAINDQEWGDEIQSKVAEARKAALRECGDWLDEQPFLYTPDDLLHKYPEKGAWCYIPDTDIHKLNLGIEPWRE